MNYQHHSSNSSDTYSTLRPTSSIGSTNSSWANSQYHAFVRLMSHEIGMGPPSPCPSDHPFNSASSSLSESSSSHRSQEDDISIVTGNIHKKTTQAKPYISLYPPSRPRTTQIMSERQESLVFWGLSGGVIRKSSFLCTETISFTVLDKVDTTPVCSLRFTTVNSCRSSTFLLLPEQNRTLDEFGCLFVKWSVSVVLIEEVRLPSSCVCSRGPMYVL